MSCGTTSAGGASNLGAVFKLTKGGKETVVHCFANGEGTQPHPGVAAIAGTLYGTTYADGGGSVYSLKP